MSTPMHLDTRYLLKTNFGRKDNYYLKTYILVNILTISPNNVGPITNLDTERVRAPFDAAAKYIPTDIQNLVFGSTFF